MSKSNTFTRSAQEYEDAKHSFTNWWQYVLEKGTAPYQMGADWEHNGIRVSIEALEDDYKTYMQGRLPIYFSTNFSLRFLKIFKKVALKVRHLTPFKASTTITITPYSRHFLSMILGFRKDQSGKHHLIWLPPLDECKMTIQKNGPAAIVPLTRATLPHGAQRHKTIKGYKPRLSMSDLI